jgi:hypothetical protein
MPQKLLVVEPTMPLDAAIQLAVQKNCCALFQGIPPTMQAQASAESWTLPCVLTENAAGSIIDWKPA